MVFTKFSLSHASVKRYQLGHSDRHPGTTTQRSHSGSIPKCFIACVLCAVRLREREIAVGDNTRRSVVGGMKMMDVRCEVVVTGAREALGFSSSALLVHAWLLDRVTLLAAL